MATSPSGKRYVGKTNNFKQRIAQHFFESRRGSQRPFHKALRKYGTKIAFEIFCIAFSNEAASSIERELIEQFQTRGEQFGYNCTDGGDGIPGHKHSSKTIQRMSKAHSGKNHAEEHKHKISRALLGRPKPVGSGCSPKPILCITSGETYPSIYAAAVATGITYESISKQLHGKLKTCGKGKRFKFISQVS